MISFVRRTILLPLLFLSISLSAQSRVLRSFTLSVERTAHISGEADSVSESNLSYQALPFLFIYENTLPQKQYVFIKNTDCYLYDEEEKQNVLFSDGYTIIKQAANDMLNWFKADFGLSETGYVVSSTSVENNVCHAVWKYVGKDPQPIEEAHTYSDASGHFTKLQMYLKDSVLFAETTLSEYAYSNGYTFPTVIDTDSYTDGIFSIRISLKLKNVRPNATFAQPVVASADTEPLSIPATTSRNPLLSEANSSTSSDTSFSNTSIFGLTVYGAYRFYKKFITNQDMTDCGYSPSCSQYMLQAVKKNGLLGVIQGYERLKRCTSTEHKRDIYPLTAEGKQYDPVP